MSDRSTLAREFIAGTCWAAAHRSALAGDASNRRYERLRDDKTGQTAVLMDAPPEKGENVLPFIYIASHLRGIGLSAPDILAQDAENGFLILEDLGDDLFSRVIPHAPNMEPTLYRAATEVLVALHAAPMPELGAYNPPLMTEMASLAFSKYGAGAGTGAAAALSDFSEVFENVLRQSVQKPSVMALRDYHADNLLWLPDRSGIAQVGLLDFQDAMAGHPAYDLVSMLQDVRRDVSATIEADMIAHYIDLTAADDHSFRTAYAVLGAQRSLRILGVFARLGTDYGRPQYVDMIPRVWEIIRRNLEHPALAPVADLVLKTLPAPSDTVLKRLKAS